YLAEQEVVLVARVEDGGSARRQAHEELRLAGEVMLGGAVRVEVIVREVREDPDLARPCAREAAGERLARELDRGVSPAAIEAPAHPAEKAVVALLDANALFVEEKSDRRGACDGAPKGAEGRGDPCSRRRLSVRAGDAD